MRAPEPHGDLVYPEHRPDGVWSPPLRAPVARGLCTDCGVSRMAEPKACASACQFIAPNYAAAEVRTHGRKRDLQRPDELFFGPFLEMRRVRLREPLAGAQWTGVTTRLGERLLAAKAVDAVITVAPHPDDRWRPVPVIVTKPEGMAQCRGMRMGYAPIAALLEPARAKGYKRVALIGIPCQVHAVRALEASLGFDEIIIIGTPCSDNTTTERFHEFLALLSDAPQTITYLEFRADFHVELRFTSGAARMIPFLQLPIAKLPADFFPLTCRTCVDYANTLADITVGYMGGSGDQWLIVRNQRGAALLDAILPELETTTIESKGKRDASVRAFIANTQRAAGGLPLRAMPNWLRPLVGWLMPRVGPKGLEFARTRIEMKAAETVLHLRRAHPRRMKTMIPDHVWRLLRPYGLAPGPGETPASGPASGSVENHGPSE